MSDKGVSLDSDDELGKGNIGNKHCGEKSETKDDRMVYSANKDNGVKSETKDDRMVYNMNTDNGEKSETKDDRMVYNMNTDSGEISETKDDRMLYSGNTDSGEKSETRDDRIEYNVNAESETDVGCQNFEKISSQVLDCFFHKCFWTSVEQLDKNMFEAPFKGLDLLFASASIVLFFYDVASDIILAAGYFRLQQWMSFILTSVLIVVPLLVMNIVNIILYYRHYPTKDKKTPTCKDTRCSIWFLRVILSIPMMIGPVFRTIEYIYHGWKSRAIKSEAHRKDHYEELLRHRADLKMLGIFEAFMESAPQLVLQMYIILTEEIHEGILFQLIRPLSMLSSLISIAWSFATYNTAIKPLGTSGTEESEKDEESALFSICGKYDENKNELSFIGTIFYNIWRISEVVPRLVILAIFAAQVEYYMSIGVAAHWIAMSLWVSCQPQEVNGRVATYITFTIVKGYLLIFCFQNIHRGQTRDKALLYHCITFTENLAVLFIWIFLTSHKDDLYSTAPTFIVPIGMGVHVISQLLFYKLFHPRHKNIMICLNTCSYDN